MSRPVSSSIWRGASLALVGLFLAFIVWESLPSSRKLTMATDRSAEPLEAVGYHKNLYAAYAGPDGRIFGIEDHVIYASDDTGRSFHQIAVLPKIDPSWLDALKNFIARRKIVRLLRRNEGPTNLVVLSSGTILVFLNEIYRLPPGGAEFSIGTFEGDRPAGAPFRQGVGVAVGPDDKIYFGEYITTERPHEVRIFEGSEDGSKWRVAYTFAAGEIFHVHGIQYDPFRSGYWVTTGDRGSEAKVLFTDDGFKSFEVLGSGTQDWRVVSLMISQNALTWGSDNDEDTASIFRWGFEEGKLTELQEIGSPSYFSTRLEDGTFVLSTTYEPVSANTRGNDLPPATDLWMSKDGISWKRVLSMDYARGENAWGPSRASIAFPGGAKTKDLFLTAYSTDRHPFTTQIFRTRDVSR